MLTDAERKVWEDTASPWPDISGIKALEPAPPTCPRCGTEATGPKCTHCRAYIAEYEK